MLNQNNILPESGEIRALYSQLEALLNVVSGVKKKKPINFDKNIKAA